MSYSQFKPDSQFKSKKLEETLPYGPSFQELLIKLFFEDNTFFKDDMSYINQNAFTDDRYRIIVGLLKDHLEQYNCVPDYDRFIDVALKDVHEDIKRQELEETVKKIKNTEPKFLDTKDKALMFFKTQELTKVYNKQLQDIYAGKDVTKEDVAKEIKDIMTMGVRDLNCINPFHDVDKIFIPGTEVRIPLGCTEIDKYLDGGFTKGDLILISAKSGKGKSSLATCFSVSAAQHEYKVLQIFFEDKPSAIQKKVMGRLTGIEARLINSEEHHEEAKDLALKHPDRQKIIDNIRLVRFKSGSKTPQDIENFIQKQIESGFVPDMVQIDYFEKVLNPVCRGIDNEWKKETVRMERFEQMATDFNIAMVVFTQGTKGLNPSADVMTSVSGSVGKFQVAHFVAIFDRTENDLEEDMASFRIVKHRNGKCGADFWVKLNNGICKLECEKMFESHAQLVKTQNESNNAKSLEQNYKTYNSYVNKNSDNMSHNF